MSRLTTLGWLMEIRSWRGQVGIRIRNLVRRSVPVVGRRFRHWLVRQIRMGLELLGIQLGRPIRDVWRAAGTTPAATPFITEAISTAQEAHAVVTVCAAEMDPVLMPVTGLRMETLERAAKLATAPTARPFEGNTKAARGYAAPRGQSGVRSGAFSGYSHGGQARTYPHEAAPVWARRMPGGISRRWWRFARQRWWWSWWWRAPVIEVLTTLLSLQSVNWRDQMPRIIQNFDKPYCATLLRHAALAVLVTGCFLTPSLAQQLGQKTFSSPEDASSALVAATQSNDEKAMLEISAPMESKSYRLATTPRTPKAAQTSWRSMAKCTAW